MGTKGKHSWKQTQRLPTRIGIQILTTSQSTENIGDIPLIKAEVKKNLWLNSPVWKNFGCLLCYPSSVHLVHANLTARVLLILKQFPHLLWYSATICPWSTSSNIHSTCWMLISLKGAIEFNYAVTAYLGKKIPLQTLLDLPVYVPKSIFNMRLFLCQCESYSCWVHFGVVDVFKCPSISKTSFRVFPAVKSFSWRVGRLLQSNDLHKPKSESFLCPYLSSNVFHV